MPLLSVVLQPLTPTRLMFSTEVSTMAEIKVKGGTIVGWVEPEEPKAEEPKEEKPKKKSAKK